MRGPGVVATTGDLIVSSDHLLLSGDDPVKPDSVPSDLLDLTAEPSDSTRIGIRLVPQNEVKLSFLLRMELDRLSRRGR